MKLKKCNLIGLVLSSSALVISAITFGVSKKNNNDHGVFVRNLTKEEIEHPIYAEPFEVYDSLATDNAKYKNGSQDCSMDILGSGTDMEDIWNAYRGDDTTIAIIDTGIDYNHPDFKFADGTSKILDTSRYYYVSGNQIVYNQYGVQGTSNFNYLDHISKLENGEYKLQHHGTNVASTAASAINGNGGCVGIAPNAKLLILKTDMNLSSINEAIKYATLKNVDVINMSLGAYDEDNDVAGYLSSSIASAYNKGIIVVAAAGNENTSVNSYPASEPKCIGVGALNSGAYSKATFSNFNPSGSTASGNHNVDLSAPGYVYAADETATLNGTSVSNRKHDFCNTQGTSFASPIVAGAAALWKQANPSGTPSQFESALYNSCDDIGASGWDTTFGYGALNLKKLLLSDSVNPTSISIKAKDNILEGVSNDHVQLYKQAQPLNSAYKDVTWSSSDSSIANVNNYSDVLTFGKKGGSAVLTATSTKSSSVKGIITVTNNTKVNVSSVSFTNKTVKLSKDDMGDIDDTFPYTVLPANANQEVIFESSNDDVLAVSNGTWVTGSEDATVTLKVKSVEDETICDTCTVTIGEGGSGTEIETLDFQTFTFGSSKEIKSGTLTSTKDSIKIELLSNNGFETSDVKVLQNENFLKVSGSNIKSVEFTYSGASGDGISASGGTYSNKVWTVNNGTTNSVTFKNGSGTQMKLSSIKVNYVSSGSSSGGSDPTVSSVTIQNSTGKTQLTVGDILSLSATVNGTNSPAQTVTWSSSDDSYATVTSAGLVTAVGAGSVTITATSTVDTSKEGTLGLTITSSGGGGDSPDSSGYYSKIDDSMTGSTLQSQLKNIINTSSVSTDYDWPRYEAADQDPNNSNNIITIYARTSLPKSAHVVNNVGWNREHTFPQSKMESSEAKADNHIIFASDCKVNGTRSNKKLMDLSSTSGTTSVVDSYGKSTPCITNDKYFDPGETVARGYVARATLYAAVMYDYDLIDNFDSIATVLKWNLDYYPNENDQRRNEIVYNNQKNRNPFVDHPEYACKIWGNTNTATKQICGIGVEKTLTSISLSGTYPTEFTVGDIFSYTGLTVTAYYSDNSYKTVTPTNVSTPNMSSAGSKEITVTYTEDGTTKTATYNITVSSGSVTPDPVKHTTALSLDKNKATINVGETVTLVATKTPADSVDAVTWSTSDSTVATVANGIVTGVKAGTATITASSNGINATCLVTIQSSQTSTDITITDSSLKSSYQTSGANLTITVSDNNFTACNVANYSNGIQFKGGSGYLSNNTALSIDSIQLVTKSGKTFSGKLCWGDTAAPSSNSTNVSEGNTYSNPGSYQYFKLLTGSSAGYLDKIIIHLKQSGPKVTNVALDKSTLDFDLYNNYSAKTLVATVTADDGADKTVTWTSSNESIATVSNGIVTPLAVGMATITAKAGDKTATCTVTVTDSTPVSVNGVTLNVPSLSVSLGSSQTLTATVSPTNATNKNVTWSSDNSNIASVDNGVVTGVGIGSTTITVTTVDGDYTATCSVTVTAAPVITYKLEASKTVFPFASGTNHTESVSLTIYKYSDNVKGEAVKTDSVDIDTTVLGKQTVSLSYNSQNYSTDIMVTNNDSSEFVGVSKQGSSVTDKLTASDFKATNTSYTAFSNVSKNNGAIYAGKSAKNSGNIQLRSKSNDSGIIQTKSGGKVTSISVVVGSGTNTLNIYGKNTAYSSVEDLYDTTKQGILIGEISKTGTVNFTADKQYDYVGVRSSDGAIYLTSISFAYGTAGETYNATPLEQAEAWAQYFINETRTEDTCLASNDSDKLSGLNVKWSDLANEYNWMIDASKDAFCDEKATGVIAEAMKHYQFITTKFTSLTKFVTDSSNAAPKVVQQPGLLTSKIEPAAVIAGLVAMVGCIAIGGYFFYKKRKEI